MPVTFNAETNLFSGTIAADETLTDFDFDVFGGTITNNGYITGPLRAATDAPISVINALESYILKTTGSSFAISFSGDGPAQITNSYVILGHVGLGNGNDVFENNDHMQGSLRMGAGNDTLVNRINILPDDAGTFAGQITGAVRMGDGDDTVRNSGTLTDVLLEGGDDTYYVDGAAATSRMVAGLEVGVATAVRGGDGNDEIVGGLWNDQLFGGADNDLIGGGGGNDQLFGGIGDDTLYGGNGNDRITGASGDDYIAGENGNDRIDAGAGVDLVFGGRGNDWINGAAGDDSLSGDAGHDTINGGAGNDVIDAGGGRDIMTGGTGADAFNFGANTGRDTITDFTELDVINLHMPFYTPTYFSDVMAHTTYENGNAVLHLSDLLTADNPYGEVFHGAVLTILNMADGDLTEDSFGGLWIA